MTPQEFTEWAKDLARHLPEVGLYVARLPEEIRELWYSEIFSRFELRDALTANRRLFETGAVSKWERDRLPSVLIRALSDAAWVRAKREEEILAKRRRASDGTQRAVITDPEMGPCYRNLERLCREYREQHNGDVMPRKQRRAIIDEWYAQNTED